MSRVETTDVMGRPIPRQHGVPGFVQVILVTESAPSIPSLVAEAPATIPAEGTRTRMAVCVRFQPELQPRTDRHMTASSKPAARIVGIILLAGCASFCQIGCQRASSVAPQAATEAAEAGSDADDGESTVHAASTESSPEPGLSPITFRDWATHCGLDEVQDSGAIGEHSYPEIMFGGVCLADLDGDGDLDALIPQGGPLPGSGKPPRPNSLYLNDGSGKFQLATDDSIAATASYCMGVFAGDIDSDGDLDLLLTNAGQLTLMKNRGNAKFEDATAEAGIPQENGLWLNAVVMDLDGDAISDIYVANYMDWQYDQDIPCKAPSGEPDYCNPTNYAGARDLLLKGLGNGRFRDISREAGIAARATRSMGVAVFDLENDGDLDIYVANDGEANLLWVNQGDGTYQDEAMIRGAAVNSAGKAEASMGVACADFDADGDEDLILTHLEQETHTVYRNDDGFFSDVTVATGVSRWSRPDTGFGIGLVDLNNDGALDLFVANGAVGRPTRPRDTDNVYAQPDRIAAGVGGKFSEAGGVADDELPGQAVVSRGAAFGDFDGDGRVDVLVGVKDGKLRVLRNESPGDYAWIALRPLAREGAAVEIGSRVAVLGIDELDERTVRPHGSYLGSSEPAVRFGLGKHDSPVDVVVTWMDGERERFSQLKLRQIHSLVRGAGSNVAAIPLAANGPVSSDSTPMTAADDQARQTDRFGASDQESPASQTADSQVPSGALGEIPPLQIVDEGGRKKRPEVDIAALAAWCRQAGLPPPPEIEALDAVTWQLVHAAMEKAGRRPTVENLGSLAMYYDGHQVRTSALELYQRLIKLEPEESLWWHLLGRASSKEGLNQQALSGFRRAAELLPDEPVVQARLAEANLEVGETDAAIAAWQKYLQIRNNDPLGWTGLANAQEAAGELEAALASVRKAIRYRPKARPSLIAAARLAARTGDVAAAKTYEQAASQLNKTNDLVLADRLENRMLEHSKCAAYLRVLANHLKQNGKFQPALEAARLLAERRPDDAKNWQMLVWLSTVLRQSESAVEYAEVAVELDPSFAPGWETLANAQIQRSNFEQAVQFADRSLQADPKFLKAHTARGLALGKLGRSEEALSSLDIALKANPRAIALWQMKVACYANSGQTDLAIKTLNQLLAISPRNPWALKVRAQLNQAD